MQTMLGQVQVISYNTTRTKSSGEYTQMNDPSSLVEYQMDPIEYSNTDVESDVTKDTQVFTDVQESKDGDTEVSRTCWPRHGLESSRIRKDTRGL